MKLFIRLSLFYAGLSLLIWLGYQLVPDLQRYLPLGTVESLFNRNGMGNLESDFNNIVIHASNVTTQAGGLLWLISAILGSVILMIPVSWTYLAIRRGSKVDQALVETILIIPIAVTGIVLIVHNSLALAFSLAGVVAGIRYRYALKSTADSLFLFLAIGVGLASGVGMFVVAAVMTAIFNYVFFTLWVMNYGWAPESKRYMSHSPMGRLSDEELAESIEADMRNDLYDSLCAELKQEELNKEQLIKERLESYARQLKDNE